MKTRILILAFLLVANFCHAQISDSYSAKKRIINNDSIRRVKRERRKKFVQNNLWPIIFWTLQIKSYGRYK